MRWLLLLVLSAMLSVGCGYKHNVKNLSDAEFDHYYALRVFMNDDQIKTYLKMKTEDERDAYLKQLGLWDRFYSETEKTREDIVRGNVQTGWTQEMVMMSWGHPYQLRKLAGQAAERSEQWVYRFETGADGSTRVWVPGSKTYYKATRLFIREVTINDGKVVAITEKDSHW